MNWSSAAIERLVPILKRPIQRVLLRVLRDVHRRIDDLDLRLGLAEGQLTAAEARFMAAEARFMAAEGRLTTLERRALDLRRYTLEEITEYLGYAKLAGDYCEFGVADGHSFVNAFSLMGPIFPEMRFHAFDSFEGLPRLSGPDSVNGYTSAFHEGQFACSLDDFTKRLQSLGMPSERVAVHKGWFNKTLDEGMPAFVIRKVAVAWIDCDLYESTVPVLKFLTPRLQPGSVIVFDDWGCYRNLPDSGEQRACSEWLGANPQLRLNPLFSYGWTGRVFTVVSAASEGV